jgi:predicted transposase YdaD
MRTLHDLRKTCVWQEAYKEGFKEGFIIGFREGRRSARKQLVKKLLAGRLSAKKIADLMGITPEEVRKLGKGLSP